MQELNLFSEPVQPQPGRRMADSTYASIVVLRKRGFTVERLGRLHRCSGPIFPEKLLTSLELNWLANRLPPEDEKPEPPAQP